MINGIQISADHCGGNIQLVYEEDGRAYVKQELRQSKNWWFYWNISVQAMEDKEMEFVFINGDVIGPWGPAVSRDGIEWHWMDTTEGTSRNSFRYRFHQGERVFFSFSFPYQVHHFEHFYTRIIKMNPQYVRREVLALSEQMRAIPVVLVGNPDADKHIVFTGRHHACESTVSYVLEGLLVDLLQRQSTLLDEYVIHYVPFIDIDGVENGDQGKWRLPHDHNRDYISQPLYQITQAFIPYIRKTKPKIGIDFHGPFKWGERDDHPFIVQVPPPHDQTVEYFSECLWRINEAGNCPIDYDPHNNIRWGVDWNQSWGSTCSEFWISEDVKLAFTFEFPYCGTSSDVIVPDACRSFGSDFGRALEMYIASHK